MRAFPRDRARGLAGVSDPFDRIKTSGVDESFEQLPIDADRRKASSLV